LNDIVQLMLLSVLMGSTDGKH